MNWKAAIDKFEERRLAIWENMPQDVYDLSGGKVPGDTNVYGQYVNDDVRRFRTQNTV